MGKTWEEEEENLFQTWWRRISSQQSKKIVIIKLDILKEVTCSTQYVTNLFISFRRSYHLVPNHLDWSSVNTLLTSNVEQFWTFKVGSRSVFGIRIYDIRAVFGTLITDVRIIRTVFWTIILDVSHVFWTLGKDIRTVYWHPLWISWSWSEHSLGIRSLVSAYTSTYSINVSSPQNLYTVIQILYILYFLRIYHRY